jgi:hypothetical protein
MMRFSIRHGLLLMAIVASVLAIWTWSKFVRITVKNHSGRTLNGMVLYNLSGGFSRSKRFEGLRNECEWSCLLSRNGKQLAVKFMDESGQTVVLLRELEWFPFGKNEVFDVGHAMFDKE